MGRSILGILLLVGIVFSAFAATEGIVMAYQPPAKALALAVPDLSVTKTDTLFNDANGDGVPSPGDTLRYEITIVNNTAGVDAKGVVFSDTPGRGENWPVRLMIDLAGFPNLPGLQS